MQIRAAGLHREAAGSLFTRKQSRCAPERRRSFRVRPRRGRACCPRGRRHRGRDHSRHHGRHRRAGNAGHTGHAPGTGSRRYLGHGAHKRRRGAELAGARSGRHHPGVLHGAEEPAEDPRRTARRRDAGRHAGLHYREGNAEDAAPERVHARAAYRSGLRRAGAGRRRRGGAICPGTETGARESGMKQRVVVVGNGMVGQRFLEQLAKRADEFDVTAFCEEPRPAYDRVALTSFFSGKTADDLSLAPTSFFKQTGATLRLNDLVRSIDTQKKLVRSARYKEVPYDKLVIATGSYPFVPPVAGRERRDCFVYRTIEDLEMITARAARSKVGVVIGGGLLGLEAAKALKDLGLETHIVEFAPRLMAMQLDDAAGRLLRRKIEALGAIVHVSKNTKEIVPGRERRSSLVFTDGTSLETDVIVFSAGIRPRDELARASGLAVGERGGIRINSQCQTTNPDIYAIGECALWQGRIFGLVSPGYQMAEVAARHLAGETQVQFLGADMSTKLKLMGVDVASIGDAHGSTPDALSYVYTDEASGIYKKLVITKDKKHMLGAILVGDASDYGPLLQLMLNGVDLPEHPEELILPTRNSKTVLGVDMLPQSALICSCNS